MAMIRVGMGATGETAVTTTPPPPPMGKLDQFVAGAKTWMSPSQIPAALKAVVSVEAWKVAPMALVGLLSVPAALLLLVLGTGAVKRRRARASNPRRRRRAANPRRRAVRSAGQYVVETLSSSGRWIAIPGGGNLSHADAASLRKEWNQDHPASGQWRARVRKVRRTANPRRRGRRRNQHEGRSVHRLGIHHGRVLFNRSTGMWEHVDRPRWFSGQPKLVSKSMQALESKIIDQGERLYGVRANPRRRARRNPLYLYSVYGGWPHLLKLGEVSAVSKDDAWRKAVKKWGRSRVTEVRGPLAANPSAKSTRRKIYARRKKNPRFHVAKYGAQGGVNYWGVYDGSARKFVSPATRNYHAQVKLAGRMNRDEPGYGAQKKAAAYAKRRIGRIANRKRKPGRTVRRAALSAKILAGTPLTAAESFDYGVTGWPAPPVGTRRHRSSSMGQWLRTRKSGPGSARKTVKRLRAKYR